MKRFALFAALVLAIVAATGARAEDSYTPPASLCAIGTQGNWCFGLLPSISVGGIDVTHGKVIGGLSIGTSLAATWMPGQLRSITLGAHTALSTGPVETAQLGGSISFLKGYGTLVVDWQAIGGSHAIIVAPQLGIPW